MPWKCSLYSGVLLDIRRQEVASVHAPNSNLCSSFKKKKNLFIIYMLSERMVSLLKKSLEVTVLLLLPGNTADVTSCSGINLDVLAWELNDKIYKNQYKLCVRT